MSFDTDFAEFLVDYTLDIETDSYVNGRKVTAITDNIDIKANIQPYSNKSLNDNPIEIDRSMQGKYVRGMILIMTSTEINTDDQRVFISYKGKRYEITQTMPYEQILPHFEYLANIVESDNN